ncbi:hypothetical protein EMCRGX_G016044 [Ephydatia muelleri]
MFQGKVKAALQLLCNESVSKGGMLPLNSKLPTGLTVHEELISKHPIGQPIHPSAVLSFPTSQSGQLLYIQMDQLVHLVLMLLPSLGCTSTTYVDPQGVAALTANRLIALDKCPGVRPIGVDGDTLFSQEGTTQGDPLATAIATVPLIEKLQSTNTKQVWYADDATAGIAITSEGKRYLGAALGSRCFLESYISDKVKMWTSTLSLIAKTQSHAAYCAFVHGVSGLWTFFLRTLPDIPSFLQPLEDAVRLHFIPSITGCDSISDTERDLFALPASLGAPLISCILSQCMDLPHSTLVDQKQANATIHSLRQQLHFSEIVRLKAILPPAHSCQSVIMVLHSTRMLSMMPCMCLRYNWQPPNLPSHCVCGSSFTTNHALTCPTGGFSSVRHNDLRDFTANLLTELPSKIAGLEKRLQDVVEKTEAALNNVLPASQSAATSAAVDSQRISNNNDVDKAVKEAFSHHENRCSLVISGIEDSKSQAHDACFVKVRLANSNHRSTILKKAKMLKDSGNFKHISVRLSYTLAECKCIKELYNALRSQQEETGVDHFIHRRGPVNLWAIKRKSIPMAPNVTTSANDGDSASAPNSSARVTRVCQAVYPAVRDTVP